MQNYLPPKKTFARKFVFILLAASFFCTNCNKGTINKSLLEKEISEEKKQNEIKQKLLKDLRIYSDSFKITHPQAFVTSKNKVAARGFFKKLFRVIGADMLGALGGGLIGGIFGGPFAMFGALIGGTAASLNADDIWDEWHTPNKRINSRTASVIDTFTFRYIVANEYDYLGDSHNDGLAYLHQIETINGSILTPSQQYDHLNSFVLTQHPEYSNNSPFPESSFNTVVYGNPALNYLQTIEEVNETNQYELINNINSITYLSEFQKDFFAILVNYGMQFNAETII